MNSIPVYSIMNYVDCPSKFDYPENLKLFDSRESITSYVVSELFLYLIDKTYNNITITEKKLEKQINNVWDSIKNKITYNVTANDYIIIQSYGRRVYRHFLTYDKIAVISNNDIFQYRLDDTLISIPIVLLKSGIKFFSYYLDSSLNTQDVPSSYPLVGHIQHSVCKEILKGKTYSLKSMIYRTSSLRVYQTFDNSLVDNSLRSIIKGIDSKIYYPRIGPSCKLCKNKETCNWYEK